jgi:cysteine desulfurase family protein (TIGR01976 family)
MSVTAFPVEAVRARFSSLQSGFAFFDAPGGTQVPDEVGEAIAAALRDASANLGAPYATGRAVEAILERAKADAARFLGCSAAEISFGMNMTTLNFALSRAVGRTLRARDEILCTKLDHDGNVSPWLELAHDLDLRVQLVDIHDDTTLDYDDLQQKLSERTRVVAFPLASNAVGTTTDARRIVELAHGAGALAWADAVHYGPHAPIDVADLGIDVLLCSPYKYFGPHLGLAFVRADLTAQWRTYKVRPADHPYETGTLAHELLAGFVAAVEYIESVGWRDMQAHERELGQRFLDGVPERCTLYGLQTMEGRAPTFAFTVDGLRPRVVAERLAERDIAVWDGNYFAVEVMERLGLGDDGAVRVGFVHYNTGAEVDRLLEALEAL